MLIWARAPVAGIRRYQAFDLGLGIASVIALNPFMTELCRTTLWWGHAEHQPSRRRRKSSTSAMTTLASNGVFHAAPSHSL